MSVFKKAIRNYTTRIDFFQSGNEKMEQIRGVGKSLLYSLADDHVRTILQMGLEQILE